MSSASSTSTFLSSSSTASSSRSEGEIQQQEQISLLDFSESVIRWDNSLHSGIAFAFILALFYLTKFSKWSTFSIFGALLILRGLSLLASHFQDSSRSLIESETIILKNTADLVQRSYLCVTNWYFSILNGKSPLLSGLMLLAAGFGFYMFGTIFTLTTVLFVVVLSLFAYGFLNKFFPQLVTRIRGQVMGIVGKIHLQLQSVSQRVLGVLHRDSSAPPSSASSSSSPSSRPKSE